MRDTIAMATVFVSPGRPSGFTVLIEPLERVLRFLQSFFSLNISRTRSDNDPDDLFEASDRPFGTCAEASWGL